MKIKKMIKLIVVFFTINLSYGQTLEDCEKIVFQTYDAINNKNADQISPYLSDDITISGHTGEIAKLILSQLIMQLNVQISNIKKVSETKTDDLTLVLVYEADFSGMGAKTSTFVFNKENKLKALEVLNMEVKTMQGDAKVEKNNSAYFTVPFISLGNLIAVEAKLNGITRTFILDNGAPKLVLNNVHESKDTTETKLSFGNSEGIGGVMSNMDIAKIESFDFQGIQLNNQEVMSMNLSHLEDILKTAIYGLIGYEVYKDYDLLFNYKNNTITFIQPESTQGYLKNNVKSKNISEIPIEMNSHIAVVKGVIEGKIYSFGIDCGAETNLIDVTLTNSLRNNLSNWKSDKLIGADKNITEVNSGKLKSLELGTNKFNKTQTVFSDISHLNEGYNLKLDGLIGYEILSKQLTLLSYKNGKIIFIK